MCSKTGESVLTIRNCIESTESNWNALEAKGIREYIKTPPLKVFQYTFRLDSHIFDFSNWSLKWAGDWPKDFISILENSIFSSSKRNFFLISWFFDKRKTVLPSFAMIEWTEI